MVVAALLLAGCGPNTTDAILKQRYCLQERQELYNTMVYSPGFDGKPGRMIPSVQMRIVCDRATLIEYPNPDYKGVPR